MGQITMRRSYDAPAEVVWGVVTDHALYGTVAPNLASVAVVRGGDGGDAAESADFRDGGPSDAPGEGGGPEESTGGEGLVRRCVDVDGNEWTERCHRWDEGRGFAVTVDVEGSDFHRRLFDRFEGSWHIADRDEDVLVTIQFDFETKYGPLGWLLGKYLAYRAPSLVTPIFDGWATAIEDRREDPGREARAGADEGPGGRVPADG